MVALPVVVCCWCCCGRGHFCSAFRFSCPRCSEFLPPIGEKGKTLVNLVLWSVLVGWLVVWRGGGGSWWKKKKGGQLMLLLLGTYLESASSGCSLTPWRKSLHKAVSRTFSFVSSQREVIVAQWLRMTHTPMPPSNSAKWRKKIYIYFVPIKSAEVVQDVLQMKTMFTSPPDCLPLGLMAYNDAGGVNLFLDWSLQSNGVQCSGLAYKERQGGDLAAKLLYKAASQMLQELSFFS